LVYSCFIVFACGLILFEGKEFFYVVISGKCYFIVFEYIISPNPTVVFSLGTL